MNRDGKQKTEGSGQGGGQVNIVKAYFGDKARTPISPNASKILYRTHCVSIDAHRIYAHLYNVSGTHSIIMI